MYDDEIPAYVRDMSQDRRIRWYIKRARREEPAYDLVDSLKTDLSTSDLKTGLGEVKRYISVIEDRLVALQSGDFKELHNILIRHRIKLKLIRDRKDRLIKLQSKGQQVHDKLSSLLDSEVNAVDRLDEVYEKLRLLHINLGISPMERIDVC